ncbi:MAG TPA: DUF4294 domain-containing protein [Ferruginibacter sp.]|nr:DUF4294 domain-containing protein [Ferruginibacter sp.]HRO17827.1 DUF4294 domain-containing protein [Ferruginibacter sp.]HRQ19768.1 DUF4294 domain-containing protein [Ferruginibacter sp.]
MFSPLHKIVWITLVAVSTMGAVRSHAQSFQDTLRIDAIVYNGDTLSYAVLSPVEMDSKYTPGKKRDAATYNRLRNAVFVTYPYARRAGIIMNDIHANLEGIQGKKERKKYIRSREKDLKREFSDPIKDLSVYQGKVLMKLIHRETGDNCYEIIKEYKGGLNARMYQTVAFFYNSNLKQTYDPQGKDTQIEKFVLEVQRYHGFSDVRKNTAMRANVLKMEGY